MFVTGISKDGDGVSALTLSPRPTYLNVPFPRSRQLRFLAASYVCAKCGRLWLPPSKPLRTFALSPVSCAFSGWRLSANGAAVWGSSASSILTSFGPRAARIAKPVAVASARKDWTGGIGLAHRRHVPQYMTIGPRMGH